jgi:hypothetical protein
MFEPESLVENSEKLTSIFGYWPSFHDAAVMELHLWRGDLDPDRDRYVFPVLTVKLHLWELTKETDARGHLLRRNHTLTTLRFHHLEEDMKLNGFSYLNELFELTITRQERDDGPSPFLAVEFKPSLGVGAAFNCRRAELLDALPCNERGEPVAC